MAVADLITIQPLARAESRPRMEHLEGLFQKYSDVNREVICKEDFQREGFVISRAATEFGNRKVRKTYHLFSWDQSSLRDVEEPKAAVWMPNVIDVHGGPYSLRPTVMRPRMRVTSPYEIDVIDDKPVILDRATREVLASIAPWDKWEPKYHDMKFPDGTPYADVSTYGHDIIAFRQCQHWGPTEECKFCDINENARTKKMLGQVANILPKNPEQVAEAVAEVFLREDLSSWPHGEMPYGIHVNGGTITGKLQGMTEAQFYLRFVDEIRKRIGRSIDIYLQTAPWQPEDEWEAYRRGVTGRSANFEVWDRDLFAIIAPGKNRYIATDQWSGREEWIRRMLGQVEVFGVGNVAPGFVAGVEMAQPWGFKTVAEAIRSTREGLEFFHSHGIVLRPISWCVESLSALGGQTEPPVEYFIELDRAWYETWKKYDLPPQHYHPIGPGRNRYPNSGAWDMEG